MEVARVIALESEPSPFLGWSLMLSICPVLPGAKHPPLPLKLVGAMACFLVVTSCSHEMSLCAVQRFWQGVVWSPMADSGGTGWKPVGVVYSLHDGHLLAKGLRAGPHYEVKVALTTSLRTMKSFTSCTM